MALPNIECWAIRATVAQLSSGVHGPTFAGKCEHCETETTVSMQSCRTAYADDSLNAGMVLCKDCAKEYHDYWDEMWSYTRG